jgi:hypothetical protein
MQTASTHDNMKKGGSGDVRQQLVGFSAPDTNAGV